MASLWAGSDPKPERRVRASQSDWAGIHEQFEHHSCVHCGLPHQSLHHILPRSQGGDDIIDNLAPLCGDGTRGCHGILESHAPGWERVAASVRQYVIVSNDRRGYQEDHAGESFNRRYPPLANMDQQFLDDRAKIFESQFGIREVEGHEAA